MLILLDAYYENMILDPELAKAEITKFLYDIYVLYDEKIRRSRLPAYSFITSSSSSCSSSIFSFIAHKRQAYASNSSISSSSAFSSELEFYLRNDLHSVYDEN